MTRQKRRWDDRREFDPYRDFVERVPALARAARRAANEDASSYRDFRVGCAVLGFAEGLDRSITSDGANLKKKGKHKVCAERKAVRRAEAQGTIEIIGLVVVGSTNPAQIGEVTGLATPTLHMCGECRHDFSDPSSRVTDKTLVVTTGLKDDYFQTHLFGQLKQLYDEEDYEELMAKRISPGFDHWGRRVTLYDNLVIGERGDIQRHGADLAQRALIAKIDN